MYTSWFGFFVRRFKLGVLLKKSIIRTVNVLNGSILLTQFVFSPYCLEPGHVKTNTYRVNPELTFAILLLEILHNLSVNTDHTVRNLCGQRKLVRPDRRPGWAYIMVTGTCIAIPLTPHFYIVKLRFTGVYIFFLFLLKTDCGYSLECTHKLCFEEK